MSYDMTRNKIAMERISGKDFTDAVTQDYVGSIYKEWIEAIMSDDDAVVSAILANCNVIEKRVLLDPKVGPMSNRPDGDVNICNGSLSKEEANEFEIDCPWILACIYGSTKVLKVLYENNADIFYKDDQEDNCLHSMVKLCSLHNDLEPSMTFTYTFLVDLLTLEEIRKLLMQENKRQLRPLEEAMFHETFTLFDAMFNTRDVYLVKETRCGIQTIQYFDVTEYEKIDHPNREARSPLRFMSILREDKCESEAARNTILYDPMRTWYNVKKNTYKPLIYMWAVFRVLYVALYFYSEYLLFSQMNPAMLISRTAYNQSTSDNHSTNGTKSTSDTHSTNAGTSKPRMTLHLETRDIVLVFITLILSCCIVLLDLIEVVVKLIRQPAWSMFFLRPKIGIMVQYAFYRIVQFSVAVLTLCLTLFIIFLSYPNTNININVEVIQVLYSFVVASCVWSAMFFLQLIPWLGHFVVAVQRMLGDLAKFFIIYCLFMIPYIMAFYLALSDSTVNDNFADLGHAMYSTFLTMLNMVNYLDYNNNITVALYLIHFFYVFMISILLINFLIAMFSSSYAEVTQNRDVIFVIQSLSVCWALENRLLGPLRSIRKFFQKKYYVYEDGRYYITKVFIAKSLPLEESQRQKYLGV